MDYDLVVIDEFDALAIEPKAPAAAPPTASSQPTAGKEKLRTKQQLNLDWLHENLGKYPAKTHAKKVAKELGVQSGLVYLPGQIEKRYEDSDMSPEFRQRRHFFYMSGCDVPGCAVTYDLRRDRLVLWIPYTDSRSILWYGSTPSIEELKAASDVDDVCYISHLWRYFCAVLKVDSTLYLLHPEQAPKLDCYGAPSFHTDSTSLRPAIESARVIKTDYEIAMIRRANAVSSAAHKLILTRLRKLSNERDINAIFRGFCLAQGSKRQAYPVIAAAGRAASTLHYISNDQPLAGRQLVVLDAGAEWDCYASDVTRTFPVDGRFSPEAAAIYAIVDRMQRECIARVRPGVPFYSLHLHACVVAVGELMKVGILHGGTPSEIFRQGTVAAFFPHGLGHHVGLEVHDVSGRARLLATCGEMPSGLGWGAAWGGRALWAKREWVSPQMVKGLYNEVMTKAAVPKVARGTGAGVVDGGSEVVEASKRQRLEKGMVVTIEPGIYFCRPYIEAYFLKSPEHSKFINREVLEKYWDVGGVRIEDDILVTEDGYENLTTAPKGEEMLKIINEGSE